jgi:ABC-type transport system involved in multi-copper enzyme maturation permease subunit
MLIALFILGIFIAAQGKWPLGFGRTVIGVPAYVIGAILMIAFPLDFILTLLLHLPFDLQFVTGATLLAAALAVASVAPAIIIALASSRRNADIKEQLELLRKRYEAEAVSTGKFPGLLGPVFHLEMLLGGRRRRNYFLRWFVGGLLILQLLIAYIVYDSDLDKVQAETGFFPANATSVFAAEFVSWVIRQQFLIILLATPVFTAGAITDEKTRGTLLYLFSADLTSWEILIGKLLGRTYEILLLLLATLPFICFIGVWGGVTPGALLAMMLSLVGPLLALAAASLLMSVWCRRTADAVVGLYAIGGLMYLAWLGLQTLGRLGGPGTWFASVKRLTEYFDPFYVAAPALSNADSKVLIGHLVGCWVAWGILAAICFTVAVARLRPAYLRQLERSGREPLVTRLIEKRAEVSDEPIRWKERNVDGIAPLSAFRLVPRWFALPGIVMATVLLVAAFLALSSGQAFTDVLKWFLTFDQAALNDDRNVKGVEEAFFLLGVVVLVLGSLVVGIRCSAAVTAEREKQTWEALLLTPLPTPSLIRNKLWGILGAAVPYVLAYTIPALVLATLAGPPAGWFVTGGLALIVTVLVIVFRRKADSLTGMWVAFGLSLVSLAAAMMIGGATLFLTLLCLIVTTMAMFYMGGAGIWCSVRCSSSWRALLATLALGYLGGLLLWVLTLPVTAIVGLLIYALMYALSQADNFLGTTVAKSIGNAANFNIIAFIASCLVLAGVFLGVPWWFLKNAEYRVGFLERVRIWRDEFWRDRPRRQRRVRKLKGEKKPAEAE